MRAILSFTGFRESDANRNGFEDGYWDHIRLFGNGVITTYHPRKWTTDVKALADQLRRHRITDVAIISYSHGQAAATAFAEYAYEVGIDVHLWCACDPIYRPTWLPRWNILQPLAFRALMKNGSIKVPANIKRTVYIRQEKDLPRGHTLIPTDPNQTVELAGVFHSYGHTQIDAAPEWWHIVLDELTHWITPAKAKPVPIDQ